MSDSFGMARTIAHQAPLSMGFPKQEYWSGLPFLSPGDLPDPEIAGPTSPALQADRLLLSHQGSIYIYKNIYTNSDELQVYVNFPGGSVVKNLPAVQEKQGTRFSS